MVRYLHPADNNPTRITKPDRYFTVSVDFKEIKFQVKIRYIHIIEKKNSISNSIFCCENKVYYPIYVSKKFWKLFLKKHHNIIGKNIFVGKDCFNINGQQAIKIKKR